MTAQTLSPQLSETRRRDWRGCLSACAILLCASGLVVADAPVALRCVALPALVIVPGMAVVRLMYGRRGTAVHDPSAGPADRSGDPALRALLTVLFGMLIPLGAVLVLNLASMAITASTIACAVGASGLVVVGAATLWVPSAGAEQSVAPVLTAKRLRGAAAITAAAAAVIAALAVAIAVQPTVTERYTTLGFLDANAFDTKAFSAAPLAPVRLNWVLRGFYCDVVADLTTVQVQVDGAPVDDVAVDMGTASSTQTNSTLTGSATFPAPRETGRHSVRLTILTGIRDGPAVPQPGFITTTLEVKQ